MQRTFIDELKYQWNHGGMHLKLIGVNFIVFIAINLTLSIGQLSVPRGYYNPTENLIGIIFTLKGTLYGLITHPWGLFTSIFAHFGLWHFAFNMIFLFFISRLFLNFFSGKRLLYTYILGGLAGGLLQVLANTIFPALDGSASIVGASGAVNAVFMAAAFYRPNLEVRLFGLLRVKLIYLAILFLLMDLFRMGDGESIAHFAHLGGALFGFLSIKNLHTDKDIVNKVQNWVEKTIKRFKNKPGFKVTKGGKSSTHKTSARYQTDEEYNLNKKKKQEEIDAILDKISKSGYDSLTKREKQILFDRSSE